ncbi:MAG: DUF427 domain-containing protein, partial [Synechococcaceae bacterium WBB_3_034]|nr:DUF427 domain-containing protein [Synechococcaceae bacterium WBB_3_034]
MAPPLERACDYPRPPALVSGSQRVLVTALGTVLAECSGCLRVLETFHPPTVYLPPEAMRLDLLQPAAGRSLCEWKGVARYYDVVVDGIPIKGVIDKIELSGKDAVVIDYKTGRYENSKHKFNMPATIYKKPESPTHEELHGGDYWRQGVFYKVLIDNYQKMKWYDGLLKKSMLEGPGIYDDLYMDITFVEVFEKEGLHAPASSHANAVANAGYMLWHANQS